MSKHYCPGRATPLAALSLAPWLLLAAGCPSDTPATTESGGSGSETTSDTSGSTGPELTTSTGDDPTTTGSTSDDPTTTSTTEPPPAICGDGVVAGSEVCDDGNDEPDDGCDKSCEKTGAVEWTYTYNGAANEFDSANAIAVDPTGKIIVVGVEGIGPGDSDALIIALGPDGKELWRKTYAGEPGLEEGFDDVVLGDGGEIYAAGFQETEPDVFASVVRQFDGDGDPGWSYLDPPSMMDISRTYALVLHDGALYSAGAEDLLDMGGQYIVRRHDLATGEEAWKTTSQVDTYRATLYGMAVSAGRLAAVGLTVDDNQDVRPLVAFLDTEGAILTNIVEDHLGGAWFDVAAVGAAGDLVLAGRRLPRGVTGYDIAVRRVDADLVEQWLVTVDHDFLYDNANGVAVGPDESLFISGLFVQAGQFDNIWGGRYAGDGTRLWTHTYNNDDIDLYDDGLDAAFGPDFVVLAGRSIALGEDGNVWVRRFKAD